MLAINGYYDGEHIVPEEKVKLKKNQKLIITILDEDTEKNDIDLSKYIGVGKGMWKSDAQDYVKELRENDRY